MSPDGQDRWQRRHQSSEPLSRLASQAEHTVVFCLRMTAPQRALWPKDMSRSESCRWTNPVLFMHEKIMGVVMASCRAASSSLIAL